MAPAHFSACVEWAPVGDNRPSGYMRLGIRLQLLLALGSLLVLAFVPLFFAVASLTRATMSSVREASARSLGRAVAGHVAAAGATRSPEDLRPLLEAQLGHEGVGAVGVYDPGGALAVRAGAEESAAALPSTLEAGAEALSTVPTTRGVALLVVVPGGAGGATGAAAVLVHVDPSTVPSTPLVRLVALYTGVVALALLVFAYIAMTRLVVRPIDQLSHAAERVASGARRLDVPRAGARELAELGASVALMTERLRADEEALRAKIDEIERYAADLKRAQESLVRSERLASVGRLAAGLAHEVGNPLAAILGFQELLLAGGLDPAEERDFLQRMKRETERIHKILRDLLDFASPMSGRAALGALGALHVGRGVERTGSVAEAARDVAALVQPQKSLRGVDLAMELEPGLPAVPLSHERLVQVLLNLLLNAADAVGSRWREEGGGRVAVRAARKPGEAGAREGAGAGQEAAVRIEVEDNGPGIAPEIRGTLFEPFATTKEVGQGTGLGLAVCRGLVEAAGGTIGVEDAPGGGARFVIELPAAAA